jgi:hypothetical protein
MKSIVDLLHSEIASFFNAIKSEKWIGKEREMVSRFAFSNLVNLVSPGTSLYSSGQIGIEVRVEQVNDVGKKEVCKDLIIWKFPYQTVWSEDKNPLVILEWKCNNGKIFQGDVDWLQKYVGVYPGTVGIAINIDNKQAWSLKAALVKTGEPVDMEWINL